MPLEVVKNDEKTKAFEFIEPRGKNVTSKEIFDSVCCHTWVRDKIKKEHKNIYSIDKTSVMSDEHFYFQMVELMKMIGNFSRLMNILVKFTPGAVLRFRNSPVKNALQLMRYVVL